MNDNNDIWTAENQTLSANFAARIDALRLSDFDPSNTTDDELKQHYTIFLKHQDTLENLMDEMPHDEVRDALAKTIQLIREIYITPLESEMARRWFNE